MPVDKAFVSIMQGMSPSPYKKDTLEYELRKLWFQMGFNACQDEGQKTISPEVRELLDDIKMYLMIRGIGHSFVAEIENLPAKE